MQRKITLSIDEKIHRKLHFLVPKGKMSREEMEKIENKIRLSLELI